MVAFSPQLTQSGTGKVAGIYSAGTVIQVPIYQCRCRNLSGNVNEDVGVGNLFLSVFCIQFQNLTTIYCAGAVLPVMGATVDRLQLHNDIGYSNTQYVIQDNAPKV